MSSILQGFASAKNRVSKEDPVAALSDLDKDRDVSKRSEDEARYLGLAISDPWTEADAEAYSRSVVLDPERIYPKTGEPFALRPCQAEGDCLYAQLGGLVASLPAGAGKELLAMLCLSSAATVRGHRKILYLMPPRLITQFTEDDLPEAREWVRLSFDVINLSGKSAAQRQETAKSDRAGVYLMPYSLLSRIDSEEIISTIEPTAILCNEAHHLANKSSARTARLVRYLQAKNPDLVVLSGTINKKSIRDFSHLVLASLGLDTPFPFASNAFESLVMATDTTAIATNIRESEIVRTDSIRRLVAWARDNGADFSRASNLREVCRVAHERRFNSAPGVVYARESGVDATLVTENLPKEEPSQELVDLMDKVEDLWITPSGDEIEWPFHRWKWSYELSAGIYNLLRWPKMAPDLLARCEAFHEVRQEFSRELRGWLKTAPRGLDTPLLVRSALSRDGGDARLPSDLAKAYALLKSVDWEGRPERESVPVRVDDYKIKAAAKWAKVHLKSKKPLVIWAHNREVRKWLIEEVPGAIEANDASISASSAKAGQVLIASIGSHGTGKNLQHFERALVAQWPQPGSDAEQLLARLHRPGQKADEVFFDTLVWTMADEISWNQCLRDATFLQQSTGTRQRILNCDRVNPPKVYDREVLDKFLSGEGTTGYREAGCG